MGYLNETVGMIGGMLPTPHDSVRIEIGPTESNRLYVAYEGTHQALLSAGAIDALMAPTIESVSSGRDVQLRPYTKEVLPNRVIRITRTVASIKHALDLPGVRGGAMQVSTLRPRERHLRPVPSQGGRGPAGRDPV
jgi:hypothetical protein